MLEQKFAAFMNSLTPEEQHQIVPLMKIFVGTMSGADTGEPAGPPPALPPGPEAEPAGAPPAPSAIPGGPPLPPPDPTAMNIGRQQY